MRLLPVFLTIILFCGCAATDAGHSSFQDSSTNQETEVEPVAELGKSLVYGNGLGTAALNAGTTIIFPPYGLYVLSNALLSVSGYEGLYVSDMLPEEDKKEFDSFYDTVTSGPGRLTAAVAGEEFRNKERVKNDLEKFKKQLESEATHKSSNN